VALSEDRIVYGIHSIAPYRLTSGLPYGILKVLGGGTISLTAEFEDLFGGSNKFQWASEAKTVSSEFTATVKSMPDFLFELFLGAQIATTAASATGTVGTITNVNGTSTVDATTGIASVAATAADEGDLKTGLYVVEVTGAATVTLYNLTDIDFTSGTDATYLSDALDVETGIVIPDTGGTVNSADFGLEFTGGSGTVAMVTGDTARFKVAKAHGGISTITIGQSATTFPEFGALMLAAKRANGDLLEVEGLKMLGGGLPIPLEEVVFAIPELTSKLLYSTADDAIAIVRAIKGA